MHNTVNVGSNAFPDNRAIAARDFESRAWQCLVVCASTFFDEQAGFLGVLDGKRVGFALFQRNCARILIQNIAARSGNLGHDIICGIQSLDEGSTVLAGCNVLADHITVRACQLKDCTGQRLLGFGVDLGDGQSWLLSVLNR